MIKNKKIFFILPELNIGGVELNTLNYSNYIAEKDFDVNVIYQRCISESFKERFNKKVKLIQIPDSRLFFQILSYIRLLYKEKPEIVINSMITIHFVILVSKILSNSQSKVIFKAETNIVSDLKSKKKPLDRLLYFIFGKFSLNRANAIICSSEGVYSSIKRKLRKYDPKIYLNYNPVINSDSFCEIPEKPQHRFFQDEASQSKVLISIGRLTPAKGFIEFIKLFKGLRVRNPQLRLLIIGEGILQNQIEQTVITNDLIEDVDLIPFTDKFERYLYHSDLFICNSIYEGFNNNIVHALNQGIKVISRDCNYGPREILIDSKYGLLVNSDEEMVSKILDQIKKQKKFNKDGYQRSLEFSIKKSSDKLVSIINGQELS